MYYTKGAVGLTPSGRKWKWHSVCHVTATCLSLNPNVSRKHFPQFTEEDIKEDSLFLSFEHRRLCSEHGCPALNKTNKRPVLVEHTFWCGGKDNKQTEINPRYKVIAVKRTNQDDLIQ